MTDKILNCVERITENLDCANAKNLNDASYLEGTLYIRTLMREQWKFHVASHFEKKLLFKVSKSLQVRIITFGISLEPSEC